MKKLLVLISLCPFFVSWCFAQNTASCDSLLRYGLYNRTNIVNTGNFTNDVKNWLVSSSFQEFVRNSGGGFSLGVPIDGVPLNFDASSSNSDFARLKNSLNSGNSNNFNSAFATYIAQQVVSKDVLESWDKCIAQNSIKTGLQASIEGENNGDVFFLRVYFAPRLNVYNCKLTQPSIQGATYDTEILRNGCVIGTEPLTIALHRIGNSSITVVLNSLDNMGSFSKSIPQKVDASPTETFSQVKIGTQIWMTDNLNVDKFRNGDIIPNAKSNSEWIRSGDMKAPAWCYYNNDPNKGYQYGRLYNWYAVVDSRCLCPTGWHIPTDAEWATLYNYLGGVDKAIAKLKSSEGWDKIMTGPPSGQPGEPFSGPPTGQPGVYSGQAGSFVSGNGTNSSKFSAIPAGGRYAASDSELNGQSQFSGVGSNAFFWSSTPMQDWMMEPGTDRSAMESIALGVLLTNLPPPTGLMTHRGIAFKKEGKSVRCIKD